VRRSLSGGLPVAALGVVFGDIGTSPLYAFSQCFTGEFPAAATRENILGICSLFLPVAIFSVREAYISFATRVYVGFPYEGDRY